MAMPPLPGEPWLGYKGTDLVHSLVYWAAVARVAPSADSRGDVVALYCGGPGGDVEENRCAEGGDFVLEEVSGCRRRRAVFGEGASETYTLG